MYIHIYIYVFMHIIYTYIYIYIYIYILYCTAGNVSVTGWLPETPLGTRHTLAQHHFVVLLLRTRRCADRWSINTSRHIRASFMEDEPIFRTHLIRSSGQAYRRLVVSSQRPYFYFDVFFARPLPGVAAGRNAIETKVPGAVQTRHMKTSTDRSNFRSSRMCLIIMDVEPSPIPVLGVKSPHKPLL